jgi:ring-1,2-phenylacetyl-CoA epoxidase subunit PaaB
MKTDTQWSRFQVFLQEAEGKPHLDVGSVHATEAELALLNARDVFARRPACTSMWVVPADTIFSKTAEELENWHPGDEGKNIGPSETYYIFNKEMISGTQTLIGTIEAASPEIALARAINEFSGKRKPFAWWVVPQKSVTKSDPLDTPSFYDPATDKGFRMSTDFKTHTSMRQIRNSKDDQD